MSIRILHGDCLIELPKLAAAGERFHAVVTDPPYGLEFMGKEWDAPWKYGMHAYGMTDTKGRAAGPSFSSSRNPMCKTCHKHKRGSKNHIACSCETPEFDETDHRLSDMRKFQAWCEAWARAVYDVLLPGGFLLAFGGTRTSHRLVCAIEDAGFEIRDTVAWLYGSGFPKSLDVSKAIDKAAGAQREVIDRVRIKSGGTEHINRSNAAVHDYRPDGYQKGENVLDITAPATAEAAAWQGWGTALKPAFEPIVVARKPLDGTVAANVLKHGCGGLNIDASRIDGAPEPTRFNPAKHSHEGWRMNMTGAETYARAMSREGEASAERRYAENGSVNFAATPGPRGGSPAGRWPANVVHDGSPEVLGAFPDAPGQLAFVGEKHGKRDSVNCYGDYGARHDTSPRIETDKSAARFFYTAKADKADRADSKHPTVKPVDLIRWLVTLACPPGGHVLDCFAGSGTTGEACMLAGFDCTLIEREAQHARDIEHRIKRWSGLDAPLFADAP